MLQSRIIPVLLIQNRGLVKTVRFKEPKYVGDPLNAVKIFNEKEADELTVIDIDATVEGREPDYKVIENLAAECRMPLCYGGGIKTVEQAYQILSLGVEKVALGSVLFDRPNLISELAETVGKQSVVAVLDVKRRKFSSKFDCYSHNGKKNRKECPFDFAQELERLGVGEIIVNSIDNDGVMKGYDFDLVERLRARVTTPITVLGGAGGYGDFQKLVEKYPIIGAAAGSVFVFKGKYKAVLINYPTRSERINYSL